MVSKSKHPHYRTIIFDPQKISTFVNALKENGVHTSISKLVTDAGFGRSYATQLLHWDTYHLSPSAEFVATMMEYYHVPFPCFFTVISTKQVEGFDPLRKPKWRYTGRSLHRVDDSQL